MSYFPTTASESSTDKDTMKHSMESDDKPKKHSVDVRTGKGSYLCRCRAHDREQDYAYEIINECYNIEQMMGGRCSSVPKRKGLFRLLLIML